ncbi:3',5'-cyclic-nucleotide phosphodiesterase PDE1 [Sugiyamaella lignohabitans]|uniref:3',5'-cyclic-nucleotide phosphodiesterase PDE1 n=1 Tax=Sugiyamaella lignohabitans TaxID=796027 RepID=A0A167D7T4_9ASCO|nr:3',5'-cyclic-nucleotide phosphodiesterase PDE1 [Sugiyamaella lignohabitans]ANB12585.1 3',5'-cyclic-nucleotide phosphodiesterase PDE1 [Sugiyamaella lignohabitans]
MGTSVSLASSSKVSTSDRNVTQPLDFDSKSIEVIVLGSSGGPADKHNSSYLVKSTSTRLSDKGSLLAIDAGCLLAGIMDILENDSSKSPDSKQIFSLNELPYSKLSANAHYILTELLAGVCLTHQHMDHIAGLILNSVCFSPESPKLVAALPNCIDSLVQNIFNGSIWPNLTNESTDTYGNRVAISEGYSIYLQRLVPTKIYSNVAKGLSVAAYPISHGKHPGCIGPEKPPPASVSNISNSPLQSSLPTGNSPLLSPSSFISTSPSSLESFSTTTTTYSETMNTESRTLSYDSSVYFVQNEQNSTVILIFGDVEADSISMNPRNKAVWDDAALILEKRLLKAIFIECSYSNSRPDNILYGHLNPKYLIEELSYLASCTRSNPSLDTLKIIITHVKLDVTICEAPYDEILRELTMLAESNKLKCTFEFAYAGAHMYF